MTNTYYIGLDVHKETIAIAYTLEGCRKAPVYHGVCGGSHGAAERALRELAKKLKVRLRDLKVCYEAGPTGFVLERKLLCLKFETVVMSPAQTERKPGEKIKTDKRDAKKIAVTSGETDTTGHRTEEIPTALGRVLAGRRRRV